MNRPAPPARASRDDDPVALSRSLAKRLGGGRSDYDEKAYAEAILERLRADRLLWPSGPAGSGARSLTLLDLARVTANVARLSGSAGLIYAMHLSQAFSLIRHAGQSACLLGLWSRLARDQALVASGTSEKGVGGDIFGSRCAIEDHGAGRLSLDKESPNISYLDLASALLVSAMRPQADGRAAQVLVAVETKDLEVEPEPAGGFLGMRGILNRPYRLRARFSADAIFPEPYPTIARETMTPTVHIFWAALWSGIARRAVDTVKAYLAKSRPPDEVAPLLRGELSRLIDKQYMLSALVRDAIADHERPAASDALGLKRTARIKRLKVAGSDLVEQICLGALALIGLPAYAEDGPFSLSEPLRDAMSARVMISNYRLLAANAEIERYLDEEI